MDAWILREGNGLAYYTLEKWLEAGADMAFSTRRGGLGQGVYDSANLGLHVEDDPQQVVFNREKFLANFQLSLGQAVTCRQVHGDRIVRVDEQQQGRGTYLYDTSLPDSDGLITNVPGVTLLTFYADCLPVYLFDPRKRAIGMVHSGWKGTMQGIAAQAVTCLQKEYECQPVDIWAAIGPGIGGCCFQISASLGEEAHINFPGYQHILQADGEHYYWDLPATIRQMLLQAGVKSEHISICPLCTVCHPEQFFSYRRDQGKTGRMGALLNLRY